MFWRVIDIGGAYFDNKEMRLNDETKTLLSYGATSLYFPLTSLTDEISWNKYRLSISLLLRLMK